MLDERNRKILWAVVQSYIDTADPVGSRFVSKKFDFGVSPATIRNIMADLEEMGYLMQRHTSSGRVPTDSGYRFYVETLLNEMHTEKLDFSDEVIHQLQKTGHDVDSLLRETTKIISTFSHYLAVASSPKADSSTFHKMEFIRYRDHQIVIMIFTNEGLIKHKVIDNDFSLTQSDLTRFSSFINSRFSGMTIGKMREQLVEEMKQQKDAFDLVMTRAIEMFDSMNASAEGVFISGLNEVVNLPDFSSIEKIKELSQAIEDKHTMIALIDRFLEESGIHVVIGDENPVSNMRCLSMVASTYKENDRAIGVIGVIGPKRMNYHSAIAIVDTAARFISRILLEK
jgi:heat-inducible transcriptional repressor